MLTLALLARHVAAREVRKVSLKNEREETRRVETNTHLHPPFFSIVEWHLSHSLVLALIQFEVSLSSAHFLRQNLATLQRTGLWSHDSPHLSSREVIEVSSR